MQEAIHTEEKNGLVLNIYQDDNAISPEEDQDDGVFLVGYHRDFCVEGPRLSIPKDQWPIADHKSICTTCNQKNFTSIKETGNKCGKCGAHARVDKVFYKITKGRLLFTQEEVRGLLLGEEKSKEYHVFGLEAYIHSGVSLALSQEGNFCDRQWDVSQLGAVFVSKKEARTHKKARKLAQGLIEYWNDYLSGSVYGYTIEDKQEELFDSCWGFYGDYETNCLPEARSALNAALEDVKVWLPQLVCAA